MLRAELIPIREPAEPALRKASPKEDPISPTPTESRLARSEAFFRHRHQTVRPTNGRNEPQLLHQFEVLRAGQRLRAVAKRMVRIGMDFHEQAIGAGRHAARAIGGT